MNRNISYELIRSSRKTIAIQISADGSVTVRAPMGCRKIDVEAFVQEKRNWIAKKQEELRLKAREREKKKAQLPKWSRKDYEQYKKLAAQVLQQRTGYYAQRMGVVYGRITIRDQRTRWGSCSIKGNLNYNWRLILAPYEVLDYVVVHELAHLKEMNHSERFWRIVEEAMTDYQRRRSWLKINGELLMEQ